jgi:hypothetical protein
MFQNKHGYQINIKEFVDEINLASFILSYGELYFINKNFILYFKIIQKSKKNYFPYFDYLFFNFVIN